jgi:hypothetical protein
MKNHFYHFTLYKTLAAFSDLFNDMEVFNYDKEKTKAIGKMKVPVIIAPKEKVISVLAADSAQKTEEDNQLPKISINWTGISLDTPRLAGITETRKLLVSTIKDDSNGNIISKDVYTDIKPVPYKLNLEVILWTKYMIHMNQLLENILPFFHPDIHVSIYERTAGIERKLQVRLESTTFNNVVDLQETDRRILQSVLGFTIETNLYKPLTIQGSVEKVSVRLAAAESNPNYWGGDVLYSTVRGISGEISTDVRKAIIDFDSLVSDESHTPLENEIKIKTDREIELANLNALIPTLVPGTQEYIDAVNRRNLVELQIATEYNLKTSVDLLSGGYLKDVINSGSELAKTYSIA